MFFLKIIFILFSAMSIHSLTFYFKKIFKIKKDRLHRLSIYIIQLIHFSATFYLILFSALNALLHDIVFNKVYIFLNCNIIIIFY